MRSRIGLIWGVGTAAIAALVGFFAYQAGWAGGLATKLPSGTGAPYYYGGVHPFGFGFFGLIPLLLIIALVVFVFRGFSRRPWGWGGPGYRGYGSHGGQGRSGERGAMRAPACPG